jgi:hypothetical protein
LHKEVVVSTNSRGNLRALVVSVRIIIRRALVVLCILVLQEGGVCLFVKVKDLLRAMC